jgi:hypothetical protein
METNINFLLLLKNDTYTLLLHLLLLLRLLLHLYICNVFFQDPAVEFL